MSALSRVMWHGDRIEAELGRKVRKRVLRAGMHLKARVQERLGVPYRGPGGDDVRYKPKRKGTPSAKGEPPRADMNFLRRSIYGKQSGTGFDTVYDVGTMLIYGVYHELHGRSFLVSTAVMEADTIRRILRGRS